MNIKFARALCCALTVLILAVSTFPAHAASPRNSFSDVEAGAWYAQAVDHVTTEGIFSGVGGGRFDPSSPMTRAMLVTALYNLCDNPDPGFYDFSSPVGYIDVDDRLWYAKSVKWAYYAKVATGKSPELFEPMSPITREEAVTILFRYAQRTGNDTSHCSGTAESYCDSQKLSPWAVEAMDWAIEKGIIGGYPDGSIKPHKELSRAEAAMLFWNAYSALSKTHVVYPMTEAAEAIGITADNYPRVAGNGQLMFWLYNSMYGAIDPHRGIGSIDAYKRLAAGEVDMIFVPDVPEDVEALLDGIETEKVEIACDGLVFYTPSANSAQNITAAQTRDIYNGGIQDWMTLGGGAKAIVPLYTDRTASDAQLQFERLVLKNGTVSSPARQIDDASRLLYFTAYDHTFNPGEDRYALGFGEYNPQGRWPIIADGDLKALSFDGINPTVANIANKSYPLTYSYFAVFRADLPEDAPARKLADWLQTSEGKTVIESANMIVPDSK